MCASDQDEKHEETVVCCEDMMKAYDRVQWAFFEQILARFGFSHGWISVIMRCVTSANSLLSRMRFFERIFTIYRTTAGRSTTPIFITIMCGRLLISFKQLAR